MTREFDSRKADVLEKDAAPSSRRAEPDLRRELIRTYGFPLAMFVLAIIPGLNFSYSGHGGPSWFLIPLCAPYIVLRGIFKFFVVPSKTFAWYRKFFALTIPPYVALALPLSWAATNSLQHTLGLTIPVWTFMAIMICPIPYWYFS
jgi:hypothetical protein